MANRAGDPALSRCIKNVLQLIKTQKVSSAFYNSHQSVFHLNLPFLSREAKSLPCDVVSDGADGTDYRVPPASRTTLAIDLSENRRRLFASSLYKITWKIMKIRLAVDKVKP